MSQDSKAEKVSTFGRYKIEVIIIKDGINEHLFRRLDSLPYKVKHDEKEYTIKQNALFKSELSTSKKLMNLFLMIVGEYKIIFREGESDPILRFDTQVSPNVLKTARNSTAIKGMIKELFAGRKFPINKWLFILIVASIGTIIYAKLSGMI